jgi:hypothetical protein
MVCYSAHYLGANGNATLKVEPFPFPSDSAQMVPPISSASFFATDSPGPVDISLPVGYLLSK